MANWLSARGNVLTAAALGIILSAQLAYAESKSGDDTVAKWPEVTAAIDHLYAHLDQPFVPGGITAMIYRGEIVHLKGYGAANREFDVPWRADTRYRLASMTKSLVAATVLKLVEQGQLSLDDTVRQHLPDYPEFSTPVTLRHLLSMTSGLWQDEMLMPLSGITGPIDLDTLYELVKHQTVLDFTPGAYYRYTDTNFRLLARIIAKVAGLPFPQAMTQLMFQPNGMTDSLAPPDYTIYENRQAATYMDSGDPERPPRPVNIIIPSSGDGSVISTMNDFIRWLLYMREGVETGSSRFERLAEPIVLGDGQASLYHLGIAEASHRGLLGLTHGGVTGTQYVFYPEIDLIIAYFNNNISALDRAATAGALTDAFLLSAHNPDSKQQMANPAWARPMGAPPDGVVTEGVQPLLGDYVNASSGFTITLYADAAGRLRANYLGEDAGWLVHAGKGRYRTNVLTRSPRLVVEPQPCAECPRPALLVTQADWDQPQRFIPVTPPEPGSLHWADYEGHYVAAAAEVVYSFRREQDRFTMRIGSGIENTQRYELTPLTQDVFEARIAKSTPIEMLLGIPSIAVKFERDKAGQVTGARLSTAGYAAGVWNFRLTRLDWPIQP